MNIEIFLAGLMIASTLTGLVTEALKKIFAEYNVKYHSNTLAGIVATLLSAAMGVGYCIVNSISFSVQIIVCIIALVFMSWLCAMVGYDKVIGQFKANKKED